MLFRMLTTLLLGALLAIASGGCTMADMRDALVPIAERAASAAVKAGVDAALERIESKLDVKLLDMRQQFTAASGEFVSRASAKLEATADEQIGELRKWAELNKPKPGEGPSDAQELVAMMLLSALGGGGAVKGIEKLANRGKAPPAT